MKANCTRQYPHIRTVASTDIPTKTMMDELGHSSIQDYHKREQVSTRNSARYYSNLSQRRMAVPV